MNIVITGFRGISHLECNFTTGINILTGPSGSGKTSILMAIMWCLYGSRNVRLVTNDKTKIKTHINNITKLMNVHLHELNYETTIETKMMEEK